MEHTAVNESVHTGCKQHQSICTQICLRVLCEWGLGDPGSTFYPIVRCPLFPKRARFWFWNLWGSGEGLGTLATLGSLLPVSLTKPIHVAGNLRQTTMFQCGCSNRLKKQHGDGQWWIICAGWVLPAVTAPHAWQELPNYLTLTTKWESTQTVVARRVVRRVKQLPADLSELLSSFFLKFECSSEELENTQPRQHLTTKHFDIYKQITNHKRENWKACTSRSSPCGQSSSVPCPAAHYTPWIIILFCAY